MAPVTTLFLCLVVVSTLDFQRTEATEITNMNPLPAPGEAVTEEVFSDAASDLAENIKMQWDAQKGLELLEDQLSKADKFEDAQSEESWLNNAKIKEALEDAVAGTGTEALMKAAKGELGPSVFAALKEGGNHEAANELMKNLGLEGGSVSGSLLDAAKSFTDKEKLPESLPSGAVNAAAAAAAATAAATGTETVRPWPWQRVLNAIRNSEAYACATNPVRLLKRFFPSLDEEALRNVGRFFNIFSVRSLFTKKVFDVLQAAVRGDFRPLIQGFSNTLFAFRMKRISAEGGYIGHKLTIKNPVKDVYIKYFINPSTIKLGVAMTGLNAKVVDLKKLIGSSMNYICTPIPGIIGAYGCLRMEMEHPLHGIGNQICMSGFMRYVFGDGPSMYFGCLKMNIPSIQGVTRTFSSNSGTNGTLPIDEGEIAHIDEQIQGLDLDDKEEDEDETAVEETGQENQEEKKSVFAGASDFLVDGISDILDRVEMSDEDKDTLSRAKQALANMMAFKDINGRLSVTPNFVASLFPSTPQNKQPEEEIKENKKDGESDEEGSGSEENGNKGSEEPEPPKRKYFFFY